MGNKKNIDRLFQEKFKDFHETPNNHVWKKIEAELDSPKDTKKLVPLWLKRSAIAASIVALIFVSTSKSTHSDTVPALVNAPINNKQNTTIKKNETNQSQNIPYFSTINSNTLNNTKIKSNTSIVASMPNTNSINHSETLINTKNTQNQIIIAPTSNINIPITNTKKSLKNNLTSITYSSKKSNPSQKNIFTHLPQNNFTTIENKAQKNIMTGRTLDLISKSFHQNKKPFIKIHTEKNTIKKQVNLLISKQPNIASTTVKKSPNLTLKPEIDHHINMVKTTLTDTLQNNSLASKEKTTDAKLEKHKESITEVIAKQEAQDKNEEASLKTNKWNISTNIAPVYYNTLSKGSPIDNQFSQNKKKGLVNTSYGVNISYALNKKISIRTGFHKLELGYDTQDVAVIPVSNNSSGGGGSSALKGLDKANGVNLNISNTNSFSVSQIPSGFSSLFDSSLNQRLGYLEVPLEIGYQVSNKKVKVDIIAGMSTYFLNKNEIYAETNDIKTYLGSGNNLNNTSFSTNIGIGLNYNLGKKVNFNLEPTFKYQLNSFNKEAGGFRPYIIGIYTGLSYKF